MRKISTITVSPAQETPIRGQPVGSISPGILLVTTISSPYRFFHTIYISLSLDASRCHYQGPSYTTSFHFQRVVPLLNLQGEEWGYLGVLAEGWILLLSQELLHSSKTANPTPASFLDDLQRLACLLTSSCFCCTREKL